MPRGTPITIISFSEPIKITNMNYNVILIILGSLLADILFCSCDFKNKHSNIVENKPEIASVRTQAPVKVEDFVDTAATIDSCVIYHWNAYKVKITVRPITGKDSTDSYSCRLSMPQYNTPSFDLGNDAGEFIIRSVDSLFVRKLVPPIVSEKYDSTVYCHVDGYSQISFRVYIGGQYIFKEYPFVNELGHKRYEFSDCFEDLCGMIRFNSSSYINDFYYEDRMFWLPPLDSDTYIRADEMPEFPDGDKALMKWVHENIRYPAAAKDSGLKGRVEVQFVVTKDGSIGKVKVVRSKGPLLDEEAIRVVKSLPKFIPGKHRGKAVNTWYSLPIIFKPDSIAK